jgi:hypothetical protein
LNSLAAFNVFGVIVPNFGFGINPFGPNILPNLGEIGERAGIIEQDRDFTNPHRSKPANYLSSFIRITYYWLDYLIGWNICVRDDIHYERFSIFDRYSYDLIVDPKRTKLNLPLWIRKIFVTCMPHPKIVFYLDVEPDEIFRRKQELTKDEIIRQISMYKQLIKSHKRFIQLDGNRPVDEIAGEALKIVLDTYCEKL